MFVDCREGDKEHFPAALPEFDVDAWDAPLSTVCPRPDTVVLSVMANSQVTPNEMDRMPGLRLITTRSTGVDHIYLREAAARGITVCNLPEYGSATVAEHTLLLLLAIARRLPQAFRLVSNGKFALDGLLGWDLGGKTLGIIGAGAIGARVAQGARGLGMRVVGYDPEPVAGRVDEYLNLDELLSRSEAIAICCPLNEATWHMIGRREFSLMRRDTLLVNTGRGAIIDAEALLDALDDGTIAAAGLDVLEKEHHLRPGSGPAGTEYDRRVVELNRQLMRHPRVLVTPHMAFYTREALQRIRNLTVENIRAFLSGRPVRVVEP